MNKVDFNRLADELAQIINSHNDVDALLLAVCQKLNDEIAYYDWVGFYILEPATQTLILGPYVGAATDHTHIPVGKGVCGQVAQSCESMVVQDVSEMDNYLSCSISVQSEIVVPIMKDGRFVAEIDIDSHALAPFGNNDVQFLELLATKLAPFF